MFYVVKSVEAGMDIIVGKYSEYDVASRQAFYLAGTARGVVEFYVTSSVSDAMEIEYELNGNSWN